LPPENGKPDTFGATVTQVSERMSLLVREEIELAKAETLAKVSSLARGLVAVGAGAVFGVFALIMAIATLGWGLDSFIAGTGKIWIGFGAMCLGMFMAILDIQVVASSLTNIQAALHVPSDKLSWIQTAYLIAEVIAIPLTGWLTRALSLRWMFAAATLGFTLASLGCATVAGIDSLIAIRVVQGFCGGMLIPSVFTSVFSMIPERHRVLATAIAGTCAVIAPTALRTSGQLRTWASTMPAFWMVPGVSPARVATILPPWVETYTPIPERSTPEPTIYSIMFPVLPQQPVPGTRRIFQSSFTQ